MNTTTNNRVLLLSGASLVGQNVLGALDGRRAGLHLMATNSIANEPALFDFDEAWLTPGLRSDPSAYLERFLEILEEAKPDLIVPCRDDDIAWLAELAWQRPQISRHCLCGAPELAKAMLDKEDSARLSNRLGLPFAPTLGTDFTPEALRQFAKSNGYPLVAKPREGFASRGVRLILDDAQLTHLSGNTDYVIQPYLGDPDAVQNYLNDLTEKGIPLFHSFEQTKVSLQVRITRSGEVAGWFVTGNVMRQGRSEIVAIEPALDAHELAARCARAFADAGWRGPLNIQCQRARDGKLAIYEYNGRFTGATAARRLLGFDEVGQTLEDWIGWKPLGEMQPVAVTSVSRLPVSRCIDQDRLATLLASGRWHAAPLSKSTGVER